MARRGLSCRDIYERWMDFLPLLLRRFDEPIHDGLRTRSSRCERWNVPQHVTWFQRRDTSVAPIHGGPTGDNEYGRHQPGCSAESVQHSIPPPVKHDRQCPDARWSRRNIHVQSKGRHYLAALQEFYGQPVAATVERLRRGNTEETLSRT